MTTVIDGRLKLVVNLDPGQGAEGKAVENCGVSAQMSNVGKETSGIFYCPVVGGEVEIQNAVCRHFVCAERR